jgi:hypothetical protein
MHRETEKGKNLVVVVPLIEHLSTFFVHKSIVRTLILRVYNNNKLILMLNVVMLNVIMLSVVMPNVLMLNVVAPSLFLKFF